jgi:hypothetical protein
LSGLLGASLKEIIPILAAAGAVTLPLGYSIGTLGMALLSLFFCRSKPKQMYEAYASPKCFNALLSKTGAADDPTNEKHPNLLYALATFHHEIQDEPIRKWIDRRWGSFNVAFNSTLAIIISLGIVGVRWLYTWPFDPYCGWTEEQWREAAGWRPYLLGQKFWWVFTNALLVALLSWAARKSWHETMNMLEFQADRTKDEGQQSHPS